MGHYTMEVQLSIQVCFQMRNKRYEQIQLRFVCEPEAES